MYVPTPKSVRRAYTQLNRLLFRGQLPLSKHVEVSIGGCNLEWWAYCEFAKERYRIRLRPKYHNRKFFIAILAHEMVHVKQFVRKEMVINVTPKRSTYYWKGKRVVADYYNQPWEIEAWKKERLLATRIYAIFNE